MKPIWFRIRKDELLKKARGIGFEEISAAIASGNVLAILDHPNKKKFPNQKIFVIKIKNYVYAVPFVETEEEIFLKTIYPSRKYKKKFAK